MALARPCSLIPLSGTLLRGRHSYDSSLSISASFAPSASTSVATSWRIHLLSSIAKPHRSVGAGLSSTRLALSITTACRRTTSSAPHPSCAAIGGSGSAIATPADVRSSKRCEVTGGRGSSPVLPLSASGGRGRGIGAASVYLGPYIDHMANPKRISWAATGLATVQRVVLSATLT